MTSFTLADEVLVLSAQVEYLLERLADNPALGERPVNWTALTRDEAAEQWSILTGWTDWLRARYSLQERIPACWVAHPAIVEELSALRSAWVGTYLDPQARAGDGTAWHDLLDRTLDRVDAWDRTGCADGTHRPNFPSPDDTDAGHRERTIQADLSTRQLSAEQ
jgi:hypothetical protein